jgi:hypothetical protein
MMRTVAAHTIAALLAIAPGAAAADRAATIVQAPDAPVKIEKTVLLTPAEGPPVLEYAAMNTTDAAIDEFTVMAFIFDATGTLKAKQGAPARRGLDPHETKYSTLVLDGWPIGPNDTIAIGVNQAQRVGSSAWWRADSTVLQKAAEAAVPKK